MKLLITIILALLVVLTAHVLGQEEKKDDGWKKSLDFTLAVTQTAYSDSWAGGEAGNASWVANLNTLFEGPLSPKVKSKSTGKLSFGQTHVQDEETKKWAKPKKSTDEIDLETITSYITSFHIDPYFGLRFESQFLDASVSSFKRYINPITLTESFGLTHRFYEKEKDFIDTRLGFALRQNFNKVIVDTLNEKTETESTTDGGLESVTDLSLKVHENIKLTSKLKLYKAITASEDESPHWSTLDVDWENILAASVTKYITVNLYLQWVYDKQIDFRGQLKETLALGVSFKML